MWFEKSLLGDRLTVHSRRVNIRLIRFALMYKIEMWEYQWHGIEGVIYSFEIHRIVCHNQIITNSCGPNLMESIGRRKLHWILYTYIYSI